MSKPVRVEDFTPSKLHCLRLMYEQLASMGFSSVEMGSGACHASTVRALERAGLIHVNVWKSDWKSTFYEASPRGVAVLESLFGPLPRRSPGRR